MHYLMRWACREDKHISNVLGFNSSGCLNPQKASGGSLALGGDSSWVGALFNALHTQRGQTHFQSVRFLTPQVV